MQTAFFRSHALTKGLSGPEIERLTSLLTEKHVAAGESLFIEGAATSGLMLIFEGSVKVSKRDPAGAERDLVVLEAPTVLGELELISGRPSSASAHAVGPVVAYVLAPDAFEDLVNAGDSVATKLTRNIARVVIDRLVETNTRMVALVALSHY